MPKFASLTDPLWKELYRGEAKLSKWQMRDEEWAWMKQVATLSPSDSINVSDILCVRVTLKFETESYSMALRPSTNFPASAPVIECSYRQGYRFCWTRDSSLLSLVSQFEKYCEELDGALAEIKEMSRSSGEFAFEEKKLEIDEEEHIVLRFKIRGSDELITAKIDWRHLDDFPDSVRSTNPARFRDLDPEDWQRDRSLTENFAAICKL